MGFAVGRLAREDFNRIETMNTLVRCFSATAIAVTIFASAAERAGAAVARTEPTAQSAAAIAALAEGSAPVVICTWKALTAPGSTAAPAPDARQRWMVWQGWRKVTLGATGAPSAPAASELPDAWSRGRNYESAWYLLRADLGGKLPASLWLGFDAVAHQCEVFVNGGFVGRHLGGYTPFEFDVTRAAHPGVNTIAVFVRDEHAVEFPKTQSAISQLGVTRPGAFGSVAGIRGGIYFEARPATHVEHVLVRTSTRRNEIRVSTWLRSGAVPAGATVTHAVYAWPDGGPAVLEIPAVPQPAGGGTVEVVAAWADALRWSPEHPNLYTLRTTVRSGGRSETVETRFGFREFWVEGRSFVLNGTPTRLLGASLARDLNVTAPPDVGRRYGRDVLDFLKREFNYRALRFHAAIHPAAAAEATDEAGFLVINQSSIWSAMGGYYTKGGAAFLQNIEREFAEWFWRDANHPSIVIWDVENEMIRDVRTPERERWVLALDRFIKQLDPSRIVEHSGAAWYAPNQETIHVHMQEQYAEPLRAWAQDGRVPLVLGEYWVGGRGGETRLPNGYEYADRLDYLQEESRLYREKTLEMRNYGASGVMPFWLDRTILGRNYDRFGSVYDPKHEPIFRWPYPGLRNLGGEALAPVIAFAWPRDGSVVAGARLEKEIVVCNDRESSGDFDVRCEYGGQRQQWQVTLQPAAQARRQVSFAPASSGELVVTLTEASGRPLGGDTFPIHVIAPAQAAAPKLSRRLMVLPAPSPEDAAALRELGLSYETATGLPADAAGTLVLVPPAAPRDALGRTGAAVRRYLAAGGRLLALEQVEQPAWLPLTLPFWPSAKKSAPEFTLLGWPTTTRNLIFSREIPLYAAGHPAFAGLTPRDFSWWNEQDGRISDDAFVRPNAIDTRADAAYRMLAGSSRRENASLVEGSWGEGTAVFCQAQVLRQRAHPAARTLLMNLLRYLDGPAWRTDGQTIGLVGDLSTARLAALSGLAPESFRPVLNSTRAPRLVVAGNGAEVAQLDALARGGCTVLVLSRETANRVPGYAAPGESGRSYAGTRARTVDEPLFWGVTSASFLPLDESPATAVLTKTPAGVRTVLGGLSGPRSRAARGSSGGQNTFHAIESMDGDRPLAVVEPRGLGRLVVTTLEPWNPGVESHRQLLRTLFANAGVRIPFAGDRPANVAVKATVPLRLDGRLDDWTNDMEDRNVSQFQHATPIVLGSRDAVAGRVAGDLELSGVLYLLHDAANLYLGGIVFAAGAPEVEVELGGHKLVVRFTPAAVAIDGRAVMPAHLATGRQPAREVSDTRLLSLATFNAQIGSMSAAGDSPGRTFEAAVPFAALGLASMPKELPARVRLRGADGTILQAPLGAEAGENPVLNLRMEPP